MKALRRDWKRELEGRKGMRGEGETLARVRLGFQEEEKNVGGEAEGKRGEGETDPLKNITPARGHNRLQGEKGNKCTQ